MNGDLTFDARTVLVTGGASGIGAAVVRMLRARGATVFVADLQEPTSHDPHFIPVDVRQSADMERAVAHVIEMASGLDALVACAGVTRDAVLWKLSDEDWRTVLSTNLDGAFFALRACVPHLRQRGAGAIVLISSINGERGKFGQANYAASKAGLIGLAKTAARELGRFGIRVNVVAPGLIETPMTRPLPQPMREAAIAETVLGRAGQPEDVAGAVLFLCSDLAKHITGQVLRVDGGQYL